MVRLVASGSERAMVITVKQAGMKKYGGFNLLVSVAEDRYRDGSDCVRGGSRGKNLGYFLDF